MSKQVDKPHYEFRNYVTKERWASMWHQIDEVVSLNPASVLEIGPGPGIFKAVASTVNVDIQTMDVDAQLRPDCIGSAIAMPFEDDSYDVVCAFQMLEHVPYDLTLLAFSEMSRVARTALVISLPDARPIWSYALSVPKCGIVKFFVPRPWLGPKRHKYNGEHYWELSKEGYAVAKVVGDLVQVGDVTLQRTYRVHENPYHRMFVFIV